jgi:hypothetical protein
MQKKTTDRRPNMHKAGARKAGYLDGDTPALPPTVSLLYTVATGGGEAVLRGHVILRNKRNLVLSEHKHLRKKQLYCIVLASAAEAVPTQPCNYWA